MEDSKLINLLSVAELQARQHGKVNFIPLEGFEIAHAPAHRVKHRLGVYRIDDLLLIGKHALLMTPAGAILEEQNSGIKPADCLRAMPAGFDYHDPLPVFETPLVSLCGPWSNCFFHWLMECLPKALIAELCGFKGSYLIPADNPFAAHSLPLLGIGSDRVVVMPNSAMAVRQLDLPTHFTSCSFLQYLELLGIFREKLLAAAKDIKVPTADRIYIARRNPNRGRRIVNEEEVLELLHNFGFERFYMEDYSLTEQFAIASQATALFGPHGSGMMHSLFMPLRSTVIECFTPRYINYSILPVIQLLRLRYSMNVMYVAEGEPYPHGDDIFVESRMLKATLTAEFAD